MTIEASQYINQLNSAFPRSTDLLKEGDDHIRMIKANLKATFPNFTGSIAIDSNSLNSMNNNMQFSASGVKFNSAFSVADSVGTINLGINPIYFYEPQGNWNQWDDRAGINMAGLRVLFQAQYPVGSWYCTGTLDINPATLPFFKGTQWARFGSGLTMVGVGAGYNINLANGQIVGESSTVLDWNHMPAHNHSLSDHQHTGVTGPAGAHSHGLIVGILGGGGGLYRVNQDIHPNASTETDRITGVGDHTHNFTTSWAGSGVTGTAGANAAHNNIQPSIGVCYWQRTA